MIEAFFGLLHVWPLFYLAIGVALGIVIGAIPGLTASMLIALTLPLTFSMNNINSMTLLIGEYVGGVSGGLIAAILLRMPGTPSSIMTTFDGYPMAQQGPGRAGAEPGHHRLGRGRRHLLGLPRRPVATARRPRAQVWPLGVFHAGPDGLDDARLPE